MYPVSHPQNSDFPLVGRQPPPPYSSGNLQDGYEQQAMYNPAYPQESCVQLAPCNPQELITTHPCASGTSTVPQSVVPVPVLGLTSINMICPSCNISIKTKVDTSPSVHAYVMSAVLCLLGCWLCFCCPCCMDTCATSADHYCPNCATVIGKYKP